MKSKSYIYVLLISAATISSGCSILSSLLGGLTGGATLTDTSTSLAGAPEADLNLDSGSGKPAWVASSSAPADSKADAGYLYGIFKVQAQE